MSIETERNEAVNVLTKALCEYESTYTESVRVKERIERDPESFTWKWNDRGYWFLVYENHPKRIKELQSAITALRAQSEAERKIEKVRDTCKSVLAWSDFEPIPSWMIAQNRVANDILEILEGKADERK